MAEGLPLLEKVVGQAASRGRMDNHSLWVAWLSEAYLLAKRMDEALRLAERAYELSRRHQERGHQAYVLRLLGDIALQQDPPDIEQAEALYGQALTLAEGLGMRPLLAYCYYGLGVLSRQRGQLAQARFNMSAAVELFRAMGIRSWLSRAEDALAQMH
jgi:tetratricopeptide (TPR) repeat protein